MATRILSGGDRLEATLRQMGERLGQGGKVDIGFLENARYPDGKSVAMIAAINEFGAPSRGQPPRPFFRKMIAKESPSWPRLIEGQLRATNYDAETTLGRAGAAVAGQLQLSIRDFDEVPLAPATIARKGFDKQLIDSAVMISSVAWAVNGQEEGKVSTISPPNGKRR